jgi:DNA-binding response OmpR family regulator
MSSILLVDDEAAVGDALRETLAGFGYEVTVANTVESAVHMIRRAQFDAVLLEFNLRSQSAATPRSGAGLEVLRQLRALGRLTPVLILTVANDELCKQTCLDAGADDFLLKTDGLQNLVLRLRALVPEKDE